MKQSKLRKRRVWRYAVLYFLMLVVFLALLVGPIVAGSQIQSATKSLTSNPTSTFNLIQPVGQNNNDTRNTDATGTGAAGGATNTGAAATGAATSPAARMIKLT